MEIQNTEGAEIGISLDDVSEERVITIRCLNAVPDEVEALLAEIAKQEEELLSGK